MKALLVGLLLLPTTVNAALISGHVNGTTKTVPWNGIQGGQPFTFNFVLDTTVPDGSRPTDMSLMINGTNHVREVGDLVAFADGLEGNWALGPQNVFLVCFDIPNMPPLAELTPADITGVTLGFADGDNSPLIPIWFAENAPAVVVPEPRTWVLLVFGVLFLLIAFYLKR